MDIYFAVYGAAWTDCNGAKDACRVLTGDVYALDFKTAKTEQKADLRLKMKLVLVENEMCWWAYPD